MSHEKKLSDCIMKKTLSDTHENKTIRLHHKKNIRCLMKTNDQKEENYQIAP